MGKKFTFYVEGAGVIVVTDLENNSSLEEAGKEVSGSLNSLNKIISFKTETDILVCRSVDLKGVLIEDIDKKGNQKRPPKVWNHNKNVEEVTLGGESSELKEKEN